jgi:hypothetical protein
MRSLRIAGEDVSWLLADISNDHGSIEIVIFDADLSTHDKMDILLAFLSGSANNVETLELRNVTVSQSTACMLAKVGISLFVFFLLALTNDRLLGEALQFKTFACSTTPDGVKRPLIVFWILSEQM